MSHKDGINLRFGGIKGWIGQKVLYIKIGTEYNSWNRKVKELVK